MQRIVVRGVSGSGKSTLARALAAKLDLPYVELDALNHQAGWQELTVRELRAQVGEWVARDAWVLDGGYQQKVGDLVYKRADTVVWLDLPVRVWAARLARRTLRRAALREELWNGNRERLRYLVTERPNLFGYAWINHKQNRAELAARVAAFPDAVLFHLTSTAEVQAFLAAAER